MEHESRIKHPLKETHRWGEVAGAMGSLAGALNGVVLATVVAMVMAIAAPTATLLLLGDGLWLVMVGLWLAALLKLRRLSGDTGAAPILGGAAAPVVVMILLLLAHAYFLIVLRGQLADGYHSDAAKTLDKMVWIGVALAVLQMVGVVVASLGVERYFAELGLAAEERMCGTVRLLAAANLAQFGLPWLFERIAAVDSLSDLAGAVITILSVTVAVIMAGLYAYMKLAGAARAASTQIELKLMAQEHAAERARGVPSGWPG